MPRLNPADRLARVAELVREDRTDRQIAEILSNEYAKACGERTVRRLMSDARAAGFDVPSPGDRRARVRAAEQQDAQLKSDWRTVGALLDAGGENARLAALATLATVRDSAVAVALDAAGVPATRVLQAAAADHVDALDELRDATADAAPARPAPPQPWPTPLPGLPYSLEWLRRLMEENGGITRVHRPPPPGRRRRPVTVAVVGEPRRDQRTRRTRQHQVARARLLAGTEPKGGRGWDPVRELEQLGWERSAWAGEQRKARNVRRAFPNAL